ncbi:DUF2207 domain-containing protein [Tessaracoccus oleiagri]|uniref:Predicted membrane protein n=1 Tax=Tessaracoccus oleiagri TaxID=686624 RepID=A0A1G9HAB9_9ACTN|nr:DUF2207 domain-containing protein [Tessaracoccus oleiagri]SDL09870.1 Predicted membrane protein [Tessaracoccus oleiagri]
MPTLLRLLAALCLALLAAVPAPFAHAAEEAVKRLSVRYDVRADGIIDVRYELDWDFGEKGRRGIQFDIVTRERWENDPSLDAVYEVGDVAVESPTGAPATFQAIERGGGSDGSLRLRVGDPDRTLDERRHTYVITYTIAGAMRTYDGVPELHLDVTGLGYPPIEEFDVTVAGPAPVERARCLVGSRECEARVEGGEARLSGRNADGSTITAVASFPSGSVSNSEPILEERRVEFPSLVGHDAHYEIHADGSATATVDLAYLLPTDPGRPHRLDATLPVRRPLSRTEDVVYTVTEVTAVDAAGKPLETRVEEPSRYTAQMSTQDSRVLMELPSTEREATVRLTYRFEGAVSIDGDTARFAWPLAVDHTYGIEGQTYSWNAPGPVSATEVGRTDADGFDRYAALADAVTVDGTSVSLDEAESVSQLAWMRLEFPADAVTSGTQTIEPSLDHRAWQRAMATGVGGGAGLLGLGAVGFLLGRRRLVRDQRYLGVPPGVRGNPAEVGPSPAKVNIPVRFEEPEGTDVVVGGLLHDRKYKPAHLSALLISLAAKGAITLGLPARAGQVDPNRAAKGFERNFFSAVPREETALDNSRLLKMKKRVTDEQKEWLEHSGLFLPGGEGQGLRRGLMALFGLGIPVLVWAFYLLTDPSSPVLPAPHYLAHNFLFSTLVTAGSLVAFVLVWVSHRPALSADGTVLHDQLVGLEQYIRTAEQHQLRYEESQDVFRRFLPWAVLLGLAERWAQACRTMAEQGTIPPVDASFAGGLYGVSGLVDGLNSSVQSASSSSGGSGGSGGSSGFSSSGGGSGGGGTGASSW